MLHSGQISLAIKNIGDEDIVSVVPHIAFPLRMHIFIRYVRLKLYHEKVTVLIYLQ